MRLPIVLTLLVLAAGCGNKIGDSCTIASDCSQNLDRECDPAPNSPGGYCTIQDCDFDSCPGEAVCIRFFSGAKTNLECDPNEEDKGTEDRCIPEEICTLAGVCVPRTAESRFCMLKCSSNSDCRGGYECRNRDLMIAHGGQPVAEPNVSTPVDTSLQGFCAASPR